MPSGIYKRSEKYNITESFLIKEYSKKEKSIYQIEKMVDCSYGTIYNRLLEYGIPIRTRSEQNKKRNKRKMSKANKGSKNPMFGKTTHGKWSKFKGSWMRSSWEVLFAKYCLRKGIKYLYEPKRFYLGSVTYLPDFYLPETDEYIEIKGWWYRGKKKRFNLFKKWFPKIKIKVLMKKELKKLGILKK